MKPNELEQARALRSLRMTMIVLTAAAVAGVGVCYLYFALVERFPILAPGCALSRVTHLYCPGCGGTRATAALLRGDVLTSLRANPIVLWLAGIGLYLYVRGWWAVARRAPERMRVPAWTWIGLIVLALGLFAVRNLALVFGGYDYLGDNLVYWTGKLT